MISDLVFPNSQMDKDLFKRLFAVPESKMKIIHNGVDRTFLNASPDEFRKKHGSDPFVLSVGRIEPRKNQLNLIRAFKKTGLKKLVLIGNTVSGFEDYRKRCEIEGGGFTTFLPGINHGNSMLASSYAACDLYVLPGWFETPGLVALEAALSGAKIAVTEDGSTREYFGEHASYFNPARLDSIASAINQSIDENRTDALRKHITGNFTWEKIAESTVSAYNEAVDLKSS